ncbi:MAG: hypothetical protein ACFFB5_13870 [Promethearchaeota archaeon]
MKITLKRRVEVLSYAVQMTIFEEEDRPEIIPLLRTLSEANETNINVIEYLQNNIFIDLPVAFIKNILIELRLMGLILEDNTLSNRGKQTLEKGEVMVPRTGPYRVDIVDDPLIKQVIIDYNPLNLSLKDDLFSQDDDSRQTIEIPDFLSNTIDTRVSTIENNSRTIDIKEIQERGSKLHSKHQLEITLQFLNSYTQLIVNYRNHTRTLELPSNFNENKLIDRLLTSISSEADLTRWRIEQSPESLTITELSRFKKNFNLPSFEIEELGYFSFVTLQDIEIYPDNDQSARQWAIDLFLEELSDYVINKRYLDLWNDLIYKYPVLGEYEYVIPTLKELWSGVQFGSQKYWFLRAGTDMRLGEVIQE